MTARPDTMTRQTRRVASMAAGLLVVLAGTPHAQTRAPMVSWSAVPHCQVAVWPARAPASATAS